MDDTDVNLYPFFLSPLKFARVSKQLIGEATLWFINFWNLRLQETVCLCLYLRQCPLDDFLPLVVAPAPIKPSLGAMWFFCWVSINWVVWAWRTSTGVAMSLYRSQYALCKSELTALWGAMQCFLAWWNVYWHCQWKYTVYMICNAIDKLKCSRRAALRAVACRPVQPTTIHILIMKLDCIHIDVEQYQQWSLKYKLQVNPWLQMQKYQWIIAFNVWIIEVEGDLDVLYCCTCQLLGQDVNFVVFAGTRLSQVNVKAVENTLLWIRWERKELRKIQILSIRKNKDNSNQKHKKQRKSARNHID